MNRYLKQEDVLNRIVGAYSEHGEQVPMWLHIGDLPSADVVPVRHGKWEITDAYPHNVYCSECHKRFAQTHWEVWEDGSLPRNYCPNCGAKMDGEE